VAWRSGLGGTRIRTARMSQTIEDVGPDPALLPRRTPRSRYHLQHARIRRPHRREIGHGARREPGSGVHADSGERGGVAHRPPTGAGRVGARPEPGRVQDRGDGPGAHPKTLGIPVIITTSRDFGPNGMLLPEHTGAGRSARICLPRWACHGDRVDLLLRSPTVAPADRQVPDRAGLAGLHAPRPGAHRARGQEIRLFEHTRVTVRRRPPPLRQPDVLLQPNTDKEREQ
jgi:hypothetical protein